MDNLTPQLNQQQLQQNIDSLMKQGAPREAIQGYINNYTKNSKGYFILKSLADPVQAEKQARIGRGEAVSVRDDRAEPTLGGEIVRGVLKAPIKAALSIPAAVRGEKGVTVNAGNYLGDVSDLGKTMRDSADRTAARVNEGDISLAGGIARTVGNAALETADVASLAPAAALPDVLPTILTKVAKPVANAARGAVDDVATAAGKARDRIARAMGKAVTPEEKALQAVTPNPKQMSTKEFKDLVGTGKIKEKTTFKPAQYVLDEEEKAIAKKYEPLLQGKGPIENADSLAKEIEAKDKLVGQFLRGEHGAFTRTFDKENLSNFLRNKLQDIDDISLPEDRVLKQKETLINNFVNKLQKADFENLWMTRKEFDREFEQIFRGSETLTKDVKKALRNGVQEFIDANTPDGIYKQYMKDMSEMFEISDLLKTKASVERGGDAIKAWIKENPRSAKALLWTAGVGGVGAVGGIASS